MPNSFGLRSLEETNKQDKLSVLLGESLEAQLMPHFLPYLLLSDPQVSAGHLG